MEAKDIIGFLLSSIVALVTGLWVYTKYFLERAFLPPVHFYVTINKLGNVDGKNILDIKIHLHNLGSATLVARNIRIDLLYLKSSKESADLFGDFIKGKKIHDRAGRLIFPNSIIREKKIDPSSLIPKKIRESKDTTKLDHWGKKTHRGFLILEHDTFVQRGVEQVYTFVTALPEEAICCLIWSSFQYAQELKGWQKKVARIARKIGLIQYSLDHVQVPHTVEEVFWIAEKAQ